MTIAELQQRLAALSPEEQQLTAWGYDGYFHFEIEHVDVDAKPERGKNHGVFLSRYGFPGGD